MLDIDCDNEGCCNYKDGICLLEWEKCPDREKQEIIFYEEPSESIYTGRG